MLNIATIQVNADNANIESEMSYILSQMEELKRKIRVGKSAEIELEKKREELKKLIEIYER